MVLYRGGDAENWGLVSTIMRRVRSMSFVVLVNGQPTSSFIPSWGLHQGDPLSPYLFLLVAETLSALTRKNVDDGLLHGVKICRRTPVVSKLFFVDDIGKAKKMELGRVRAILVSYEVASGQTINLNKSKIFLVGEYRKRGKSCWLVL